MLYELFFYNCYFIFWGTFIVASRVELSLVGFLYGDVVNLLLLVESVRTSRKEFFLLMCSVISLVQIFF